MWVSLYGVMVMLIRCPLVPPTIVVFSRVALDLSWASWKVVGICWEVGRMDSYVDMLKRAWEESNFRLGSSSLL
ncbi:hypothetical protein B0T25DRAFT_530877 [Lasiosphaeria hispida]|uniref:Uncharacterized protein n=1 Tax=Lasiosphaeria hispida TaxID=260671 RepID=A0AAJ0HP93_9PEZI|nr:hypothetical protein B0T25DRAFT_530877 [Lasiosphaeria hispida]